MWVTLEQVQIGAAQYYERDIAAKATGAGRFLAYFMLPSVPGTIKKLYDQYSGSMFAAELFNEEGKIDLDKATEWAKEAMTHCGGKIQMAGFILNEEDIEDLRSHIMSA